MSDDKTYEVVEKPLLLLEVQEEVKSYVEVETAGLVAEIEECEVLFVEPVVIDQGDINIDIVEELERYTEVSETEVVVEFIDQLIVNNPDPFPAAEAAERVEQTYEAGAQIQVNRAVAIRADGRIEHADKDTTADADDILGVARQSGAIGQQVKVTTFGRHPGFSGGVPGDNYYLGADGVLTTTVPETGIWLYIGVQAAPNELFVDMSEPIMRS